MAIKLTGFGAFFGYNKDLDLSLRYDYVIKRKTWILSHKK
jgi:hypothetical protein